MAYARRWQMEMSYRACKANQYIESPRLRFWENRISLSAPHPGPTLEKLLRNWCYRTGERHRQAAIPLSDYEPPSAPSG